MRMTPPPPDAATEFQRMYVAMSDACRRVGIPAPTPEQWMERLDEMIAEGLAGLPGLEAR